jgi:hypothetical protein
VADDRGVTARPGVGPSRQIWRWSIAAVATAFGVATIAAGGRVLLGGAAARASAGAYVPFVVVFNFAAGFAYVAAGLGLALERRWTTWLASAIAGSTVIVFAALGVHVASGGAFESRTVAAMTLRSAFWIAVAVVVPRLFSRPACPPGPTR